MDIRYRHPSNGYSVGYTAEGELPREALDGLDSYDGDKVHSGICFAVDKGGASERV
jgi:hypothetical protein